MLYAAQNFVVTDEIRFRVPKCVRSLRRVAAMRVIHRRTGADRQMCVDANVRELSA